MKKLGELNLEGSEENVGLVLSSAELMAHQLATHEHQGTWRDITQAQLFDRLRHKVHQLEQLVLDLQNGRSVATDEMIENQKHLIALRAADVQNYALFVADVVGALNVIKF